MKQNRLIVALTGATGVIYGVRLLQMLKDTSVETHLMMSKWAARTLVHETSFTPEQVQQLATHVYPLTDQGARLSSGSFITRGMVVIPCSMRTLSAIAHGQGDNLIHRAADVILKERRKLVLVAREAPLNDIHIENMLRLSRMGVVICPPVPAFYHRPQTLDDIINYTVIRILDQFDIHLDTGRRWDGISPGTSRPESAAGDTKVTTIMNDALSHITVVEFGAYAAGPAIGKYLANFGARVIHVESSERPDGFRLQYPPFKDNRAGLNRSGCFAYFNDSKLGVTLNMKHARGQALALDMLDRADVVIENMRPGVMERLGVAPADVRRRNPRLVVLSTTNMGQTGPYARHPGFGSQLSSLSGFTELIGHSDGPPQLLYGPYIDMIAVAFGGCAVLAALERRERTGEGAHIDLSQYETGLQFVGGALLDYSMNGVIARRNGNRDPVAVPHGCYPCADAGWCTISCWDEPEWRRLCEVAQSAWPADARFATADARRLHQDELDRLMVAWTKQWSARVLTERLQAARVHAGVVNSVRDLFDDPQLLERKVWQAHDHAEMGSMRYRMLSYQLSDTPGSIRSAAPRLGEHNAQVFRDWMGISPEEYGRLEAQGVFS